MQNNSSYYGLAAIRTNSSSRASLDAEMQAVKIVYLGMDFVAALSNILMIVVIVENQQLRKGCGWLIVHCLLGYAILCGIFFPTMRIVQDKVVDHTYAAPASYCSIMLVSQLTVRYSINIFEVAISFNRVVAVCRPHYYRYVSSSRFISGMIVMVWFSAFCLALPGGLNFGLKYFLSPLGSCAFVQTSAVGMVNLVLAYYSPLALAAFGYVLIYAKIMGGKCCSARPQPGAPATKSVFSRRIATANMMFVAFLWNTAFYLLIPVLLMVAPTIFSSAPNPKLYLWITTVQVFGYMVNPVIFCAMNRDYKSAFKNLLMCKKPPALGGSRSNGQSTKRSAVGSGRPDTENHASASKPPIEAYKLVTRSHKVTKTGANKTEPQIRTTIVI